MESVRPSGANPNVLKLYEKELGAEEKYRKGDYTGAVSTVQAFLDEGLVDEADRAWYLQEMARYYYKTQRIESRRLQVAAHKRNHLLLSPRDGVTVSKLTIVSEGRMERIISWVKQFENYQQLDIMLSDILARLSFGVKADKFEQALDELSKALGFIGERPDKEWKEGPDNLWALDDTHYILWECKNEVNTKRAEINKGETEQMNRSCAWFKKYYSGSSVKNIMIHPTHKVSSAANFLDDVEAMRESELKALVKSVSEFFKSFESMDFNDLSSIHIQNLVDAHNLSVKSLLEGYTKSLYYLKYIP
jgi:hypothetical protein